MAYEIYILDGETTGMDAQKNDLIELCMWRLGDEESKTWRMKPKNPGAIRSEALRINGHKLEDLLHQTDYGRQTYLEQAKVLPEIEMWVMNDNEAAENRVIVGQNPKFDLDFMIATWQKNNSEDTFPFGYWIGTGEDRRHVCKVFDTLNLVELIDVIIGKHRPRYNLANLAKDFKITKAQAHRADGDVKMTKDLFVKLFDVLKPAIIANFSNEDSV